MLDTGPRASRQGNVPLQLTSFVGRELALDEVERLLASTRLVTLVGAPGVGKTRLALQVAARRLDPSTNSGQAYRDGVWLVELAALTESAQVPRAVASALGVHEQPGRPLSETLADVLAPRSLLLVLDNCEHLVEACAHLAWVLLRTCSGLRILATSRQPLRSDGETTWWVPSLSVPRPERAPTPERLAEYDAVDLFVERAQAALPIFEVTNENAPAVADVCRRLDGIPLALELAAARIPGLSVQQIARRLDDRFRLLAHGRRTALPRHQTLRGMIDWSYGLLAEPERVLLRRLAVFAGWTLDAAEAICNPAGALAVDLLDGIASLVDQSLVRQDAVSGGEPRYAMLETIREYGLEQLEASGEAEEIWRRHASYFVELAERAAPELFGREQLTWAARLDAEHDNLRAALRWAGDRGEVELGLRMGAALWRFWHVRGHYTEGRDRLTALLSSATAPAHAALRGALLVGLGILLTDQADYAAARSCFDESLAIWRRSQDERGIARALTGLAWVAIAEGDFAAASILHEAGLAIWRRQGDRRDIAYSLSSLGWVATTRGDHAAAHALLTESLEIGRQLGDKRGITNSLLHLAWLAHAQGDSVAARGLVTEALVVAGELRDRSLASEALELSAKSALRNREGHRAARLLGSAHALREAIGAPIPPSDRAAYEEDVVAARALLRDQAFAAAWAEGRTMTLEQAIALALAPPEPAPAAIANGSTVARPADPLTRREREVAALIARGLTNRQIAEELVIAERTAHAHVGNILGKLGFPSRAQVAAWAVEQGLLTVRPS